MGLPGWAGVPDERLSDIAGADQAKNRLREIIQWLTDPTPLRSMGLHIPKGILLVGPPGTGKTSLARAIAGEADVPFFAIAGSEVFSKWVGESEQNIRELFGCARRYAPSVVFIDEIDSLGRRGDGPGGDSGSHLTSALNELLTQMDGFRETNSDVFVLAATNRPDVLDPALLRPGRFDLQIEVEYPNATAREALLQTRSEMMPLEEGLDLTNLIPRTAGMSGADIRQICNEAGMSAMRRGSAVVARVDFEEAVTTIRAGLPSETMALDQCGRWATAVHEAGHTLAQNRLFPDEPVAQVSILPRGRALGFSEPTSTETYHDQTRQSLRNHLQVLLAGRAAEKLLLGDENISSGCSSDLERATTLAVQAIARWGMDPAFGLVSVAGLRRGLGDAAGRGTLSGLDAEIPQLTRAWLDEASLQVAHLFEIEHEHLAGLATAILHDETLFQDRIQAILGDRIIPGPT